MQIQPLILAAGKGTRMRSKKPKVLQLLSGRPMLAHVLSACKQVGNTLDALVVVGFGSEKVRETIGGAPVYIEQLEQLGTGHAAQIATDNIIDEAIVVVLYGDVPLIAPSTIVQVAELAQNDALSLLTLEMVDPSGYGRIVRDDKSQVCAIVEHKDATSEQLQITEINTGVLAMRGALLKELVAGLSADNAQSEYYLTDIVAMAIARGLLVNSSQPANAIEVVGVNDRRQLAALEVLNQQRIANRLLDEGATLSCPNSVAVNGDLQIGQDVSIGRNVVFEGTVSLGDDVRIDPNCVIIDSTVADGAHIRAFSHIEGAFVGSDAVIGPYARLRQGSNIGAQAKIGNFVETKNIELGQGSKANHLSYLGDSDIGPGVNIGAGTITCNYDGKNKHRTRIEERAFVGSNSALVAPVTIGRGATVAAGSVVTKDVADNALALVRAPQKMITGWKRPDQT